ncbi:hypothetical protein KC19_4G164000 [Ceratodon purpureus]|uniref:Uncharacterized protein n=1 Tax=Ceratodon purpureus TaxID=3225 RepID=A0A8T0IBU9_CERPU|nr:hypothetical protein KC19_4G164000 [Ceratodon purpureus]
MANKKLPPCDPILGIRRFAGPTKFDWIGMSFKNKWLLLSPWNPNQTCPKPRFPPGFVSFKPPPRWPKDRRAFLSNTYVNVRLFRGLEGVQVLFVCAPLYEFI